MALIAACCVECWKQEPAPATSVRRAQQADLSTCCASAATAPWVAAGSSLRSQQAGGLLSTPSAGDIIDFHNSLLPDCPDSGLPASEKALREVLQHFDRLERPTLHLLG